MSLFQIRKLYGVEWDRKMTTNCEGRILKKVVVHLITFVERMKLKLKLKFLEHFIQSPLRSAPIILSYVTALVTSLFDSNAVAERLDWTILLPPWKKVLVENLRVAKPTRKISAFYVLQRFIAAFIRGRH
jgi:hypothetical protein